MYYILANQSDPHFANLSTNYFHLYVTLEQTSKVSRECLEVESSKKSQQTHFDWLTELFIPAKTLLTRNAIYNLLAGTRRKWCLVLKHWKKHVWTTHKYVYVCVKTLKIRSTLFESWRNSFRWKLKRPFWRTAFPQHTKKPPEKENFSNHFAASESGRASVGLNGALSFC